MPGDDDSKEPDDQDDVSEGDRTATGLHQQFAFLRPKLTQRPWLLGVAGTHSVGKLFPLEDGMIIGRGEDADIVLEEDGVSRKHARVIVLREAVRIADLESSNGIRVDGARVKVQALRDGQRLRIGDATLTLVRLDDNDELIRTNLRESMERLERSTVSPNTPRR